MKLTGKRPLKLDDRTLLLSSYVTRVPPAPARAGRYTRVKWWPMYANNRLNDCTVAAAGHMVQSWTAYASRERTPGTKAVEDAYFAITGGRDDGAYCLDVLKRWRKAGIAGDTILGFAKLRDASIEEAKHSIVLFGSCYVGLALPDFALTTRKRWNPWPAGPVRQTKPNESNGHCVCAVGYDADYCYIVTWGRLKPMSWEFYRAYVDEAYAVLDRDWLRKDRVTPSGFDLRAMQRDLREL